jgi:iron complex transport system permease protein
VDRRSGLVWCIGLATVGAWIAALSVGSVALERGDWFAALVGGGSDLARDIVWGLRAPRAFAGFACGALLALTGVLLQALLRNPLADPYVIGVSSGASAGALTAMLFGASVITTPLAAMAGAALVSVALIAFAARSTGWDPYRVLLAGVGLASAGGALVSVILTLAPAQQLHGMLFWLIGDLSAVDDSRWAWGVLAIALIATITIATELDLLALGPLKATSLGVAVTRLQWIGYGAAIATTSAAVLVGGNIGFVGLVVPHLLRLTGVNHHRLLLPLAALAGGGLVVAADTLARTIWAPIELPIGAITALLGVPVLLFLLTRRSH